MQAIQAVDKQKAVQVVELVLENARRKAGMSTSERMRAAKLTL